MTPVGHAFGARLRKRDANPPSWPQRPGLPFWTASTVAAEADLCLSEPVKALKISLFAILALLVLVVVAVVVLSLPGVQRAVVTRVLPTGPGQSVEVDYLHAGINRTEIRGLTFRQPDASYQVATLTADLSLLDLLFRGRIRIDELHVTGLLVDLSSLEPAEEEEKEPFEGILTDLPMPLHLNRLHVEGQVLFPGAADQPMLGQFVLTGGGFAPGSEGELQLVGDLEASSQAALFAALGVEGNMTVFQAEGGRIERARLHALISAPGLEAGPGERLSADFLLLATDEGEAYEARIGRVLTGQAQEPDQEPDLSTIITLDATYNHNQGLMQGRWELEVDQEQLAAFLSETELPSFAATGSGEFSYGLAGELLDAVGQLDVNIDDLSVIAGQLGELGGFGLSSRFNLGMDADSFRLEELVVELRDQETTNLLEVRNFQPIHYDRTAGRLQGAEERLDLAELTINALPVEWANLFLQAEGGEGGLAVRGGQLTGQLVVSAEAGAVFFRLVEPLRADAITLLSDDEPLLAEVSFEANGSGSFEDGRIEATVEPVQLFHQERAFLSASGTFDSAADGLQANVQADLPVLLSLPILADYNNLSAGTAEMQISLAGEEWTEIEVNGTASGLVSRDEQLALADVAFQILLQQSGENAWEIDAPLTLESQPPTDLRLAGGVVMEGEITRFDLNLTGEHLGLEEVTALASAFSAPEGPASSQAPNAPGEESPPADGRDEEPVWTGLEGTVSVNVASVQIQEGQALEELRGDLAVDATSVVTSLRGSIVDSPVEVDARLDYVAAEERPYVLEGLVEVPSLAAGEIFRQLQPDRPPTLEGLFGGTVEIDAVGRNLTDLADRVQWVARLGSSGKGVIRLLYTENPMAGLGIAAGVILGTVQKETRAISQIASRLSNMPYDEINLLAERDEELNIVLRDFAVLSPELHLQGVGEISHREGVEVLQQPMRIQLRMGALGTLQENLATLQVLGNETDEQGYVQLRDDFIITGTPANPNATAFYRMLAEAALRFVVPEEDEEGEGEDRDLKIPDIFDILGGSRRG